MGEGQGVKEFDAVTHTGADVAAEESADFARVAAMAQGGDAPVTGAAEQEPDRPAMDAGESLAGLLSMVGIGAGMVGFNAVAAVWVPDSCEKLAGAAVPVLRKYPWGARILDFLERGTGAEEAVLLVALAGMGKATFDAYKLDTADAAKGAPAAVAVSGPVATETAGPVDLGGLVEVHGHANQ